MIQQILDLHIHSKYSRACSPSLALPEIASTCQIRGIDIVSTGDFTHPGWFQHMKESLVESSDGIYRVPRTPLQLPPTRGERRLVGETKFILGTEVACIKKHKGKTRRVHVLLFAPSFETVEKLNAKLSDDGFNVRADGRPILGMTCKQLLEYVLEIDNRMVMIPAHAWTPWFGILGSKGGYDSLEEAFEELTPHIFALETGLSSDPLMNWRVPMVDHITMISNSDAHSLAKLGREANVFQFENEGDITYDEIFRIIREEDRKKFLHTIEFYPEEGKYHIDGHRDCHFSCQPEQTKKYGGLCPKCKKPLVIGVMNRVVELAGRNEDHARAFGVTNKVPYKSLVPLQEIIADSIHVGWQSKKVQAIYHNMIDALGSEFHILLNIDLKTIESVTDKTIANAIDRVRRGDIHIVPGYDGEFGVVKVFGDREERGGVSQSELLLY